ncbi:MAG: GNAT family N-acetyltransferase [Candidatus Fluviicola riflensis]|nr:MAG: GNAT family N-acetyltransferase [Candidatus Fluviicola riflensis]OGS75908.1 MAG: GNAT family N-acetyltransferase [Candidatus Fluviicola riflensis]OGS83588.1 MAG: GNAT family N-acetyltransferase [Fluviicola sp. RIFCSPHIGHO2_01_FULL_43_53]OGS85727.1 MAG: GNAT family N-acetyltransferase [Fluviicola sp. RIFCSPHIGHO2_12_FULL_43_24]
MEILQKEQLPKGRFYIEQEGKRVALMTYVWSGDDRIIIEHTEVDPVLRGKNAGKQLVAKAVEFARERGIKIIPLCPFARSVFDKVPEYRDVL